MKTLADRDQRLLESARRALGPRPTDQQRAHDRLAVAIAAGALPTVTIPNDGSLIGSTAASGVSALRPLAEIPAKLVAGGLLIGGLGFGAGYVVGRADAPRAAPPQVMPMAQPPAPARPTPAAVDPTSVQAGLGSEPAQRTAAPGPHLALSNATPLAEPSSTPSRSPGSLAEEVELLAKAQRALRAGDHQAALGLLGELSRRFPKGALLEEREAAQVLAMCGADPGKRSAQRARAFVKAHRGSVYAARIRAACAELPPGKAEDSVRPAR